MSRRPKPIFFAGLRWASATECSRTLGVARGLINRWIAEGYDDFPPSHGNKAEYSKGPYRFGGRDDWPTVRAIAEHYGKPRSSVLAWLKRGLTEPPPPPAPIHFAGREWATQKEIAEGLGYDRTSIGAWLAKGLTEPPGNKSPNRGPFTFNGATHRTLGDLAVHEGIGWRTARRWVIELGLTETPEWHRQVRRADDRRIGRRRA